MSSRHRRGGRNPDSRHRKTRENGTVAMLVYLAILVVLCVGAVTLGTQSGIWWSP